MRAGKLIVVGFMAALIAVVAATGTSARPGATPSSRLTIQPWPRGVFGYVKSPAAKHCGAHRRIAVFKKRGGHRGGGRRIAVEHARRNHGLYQWSTRIQRPGKYYAKARRRAGCRPAVSKTLRYRPESGGGSGNDNNSYPTCSPYISEGTSQICDLKTLGFGVLNDRTCDSFGDTSTSAACYGHTDVGPYPWGMTPSGQHPNAGFYWDWSKHTVLYVAYKPGQSEGYAHLGGTMPGPSSGDFTITDGFAQNDLGYPNGDHFYTPDLPGQGAGEVGGPLNINVNYSGGIYGVTIKGFLYLKRAGSR